MRPNLFFRRRDVWLPTWRGTLLLAAAAVLAGVALVRSAHGFFAVTAPVPTPPGDPAPRLLVIEGWLNEEGLAAAARHFRDGGYARAVTSGGPITGFSTFNSYAERAAEYLNRLPLMRGAPVTAVPSPPTAQDRTYASAVWVRDWAQREGVPVVRLDVVSLDVHARRTWVVYRLAFGPESQVGIIALPPTDYDGEVWWRRSDSFKHMLGEVVSLAWTTCCFWPAPRGTHEERWAVPAGKAAAALQATMPNAVPQPPATAAPAPAAR